ncbi:amidohydrolase family protein [Caulobacter segnis]|uniref:Amidohydrolase n=1 Tax=Caulobacter segnis TaxID=88688 RepID=A0A2W5V511_9CAUL|nr:amidohydrolase family protein [Caulobacter segnis]PZR34900.1 MAG: amidohydrolase [Caulobacter segnis]
MRRALPTLKAARRALLAATFLAAPFLAETEAAAQFAGPGLSLLPTRTLNLSLREATWMQPDISPDGKTILFNVLGDIYAVDAQGGQARPVLTGQAFETAPVYSPDGRSIAFISDRSGVTNLWVVNADGTNPRQVSCEDRLTVFATPAWAPDGSAVYVSRMKHPVLAFELWRFPLDGSGGKVVVKAQPNGEDWDNRINAMGAVISPDGRYAYYAKKLGHTWTEKAPPNWSIARRDLTTEVEDVIIQGQGGAMSPALSHDGRLIAYASRWKNQDGLRLRDLTTGQDRWLAFPIDRDAQEQGYYYGLTPRFTFTADDRALIASVDGKLRRIDVTTGAWTPIPFTVDAKIGLGPLTRVSQVEETGPVRVRLIQTPTASPNGQRVAFIALGGLYVQDLKPGGRPAKVKGAPDKAFQPRWSPDGKTLVFVTWDPQAGGAVWRVPAAGGKAVKLTNDGAFYTEPTFSPDGASVVVLKSSQYDRLRRASEAAPDWPTDIVKLPASGGAQQLVAHTSAARLLSFGADPRRVRFYSGSGVQSVALDGADAKPRTEFVGKSRAWSQYVGVQTAVEEIKLSPAGDKAILRTASELYLVDVPPAAGGKTPEVNLETATTGVVKLTRIGADFFDWAEGAKSIVWSVGSTLRKIAVADIDRSSPGASEAKALRVAAPVEVPRDAPEGVLVLRGATVATMRGDEVIQNADVVISGNRIVSVGRAGAVPLPKGAVIRDVAGKVITPGLIDAHAHWFDIRRQIQDPQPWSFLVSLSFGITSSLDPQTFTNDQFVYQDMADAGLTLAPRLYSTGPGVFTASRIDSQAEAEDVLRRYRDEYRTRNIKSYMVGDRAQRQYMVEAAKTLGMMPTTEGASDLNLNLTHVLDGFSGNEHALPVSPLREDVVQLFAQSRTSLVPTLNVLYGGEPPLFDLIITRRPQDDPRLKRFMPPGVLAAKLADRHWTPPENMSYASFAKDALNIQRAGGVVGLGSHSEVQGLGFAWEMQLFASGGATPLETIRAATMGSAEAIGRTHDVGSLEPGKFADLLIFDADPLADIANVEALGQVMKNGRLYQAATLEQVWPERRAAPVPWFQDEAPSAAADRSHR